METYASPAIGMKAPRFQAETTYGAMSFPEDYSGKWVTLFSYPGDFSPVCATEIMSFASMADDFSANNCVLLGLSADSAASHIEWTRAMEKYHWKNIHEPKADFPIIADDQGQIARLYGMASADDPSARAARHVIMIDPEGTVRAVLAYPATTGRNTHEILRLLLALQASDATGNPTPCNWVPGDELIDAVPRTANGAQKRIEERHMDAGCIDWYLCFTKDGSAASGNMQEAHGANPQAVMPVSAAMNDRMPPVEMMSPGGAMPPVGMMPPVRTMPPAVTIPGGAAGNGTRPVPAPKPDERPAAPQKKPFTLAELARYNGKSGMPAYAAVNGVVYDLAPVLGIPAHMSLRPGADLTREFTACHMGMSYLLNKLPAVGVLAAKPAADAPGMQQAAPPSASIEGDYLILRDYPVISGPR
ncbi:MAG: peroxiredoxin [Clostridia bacterium]|nr:peroxiredoxin [Clostridia bacterium]